MNTLLKYQPADRRMFIVSAINGLQIRSTDCSSAFDYMMKSISNIKECLHGITSLEMFEIIIRLDTNGIKNMNSEFFPSWLHSHVNIWDWRNLCDTLNYLYQKNNK